MEPVWQHRFARRTKRMESSAIRELLKLTARPEIISFAGGLPAPDVFPIEKFKAACDVVLTEVGAQALQYHATEGYLPLREMIARHTARYNIHAGTDNILITSGSQQALDLLGKILINEGDRILVEAPTYLGAIQAWHAYGAEFITVPIDEEGMRADALEAALRAGPKFIYALPNFQNPTGITMSLARRQQLVTLANRYGVPIIEDDPYGQLRYAGTHLPSLVELDGRVHKPDNGHYTGNIIYLSTFSKTLAPGLRLAWVVAPPVVIQKLVQAKQGADLQTGTFNQMVAYEAARNNFLDEHIVEIREVYGARLELMLKAFERYFPPGVTWTLPEGGLFVWVTLPENLRSKEILALAIAENVAFVPGSYFYPNGGGENSMRLNFSYAKPEMIDVGVQRLGKVIRKAMDQE